ncbi:MAG TPA: MmcQ/YjbR family DNA-binding protein [Anaerolineaceae bacterium]|nr:MmcQ/YjbR family DNA-binding protein [Anaerolineaceae bacterium]
MDFEVLKSYLFNLPESRLEFPQGPDTLVYKIMGKPFVYIAWQSDPIIISLRCDPQKAFELRNQYPGVMPGYHMNRTHWNSILLNNNNIPDELFLQWVEDAYYQTIAELPGILRKRILKKLEKLKTENK